MHGRKEDRISSLITGEKGDRFRLSRSKHPKLILSHNTTNNLIAALKGAHLLPKNHKNTLIPRSLRLFPFFDGFLLLSFFGIHQNATYSNLG